MASDLNRFNWIAPIYNRLAKFVFGSTLLDAQLIFVDSIAEEESVLILGGGSGEFLEALLTRKPLLKVCYIEASEEMLRLSKARVRSAGNIDFIHGTEDNIPDSDFNVVITNFFLDLFPEHELKHVIAKIDKRLQPGGKWIVTDFENTSHAGQRLLLSAMYLFFRITRSIRAKKLPDLKSIFAANNYYSVSERTFRNGFIKATLLVSQLQIANFF